MGRTRWFETLIISKCGEALNIGNYLFEMKIHLLKLKSQNRVADFNESNIFINNDEYDTWMKNEENTNINIFEIIKNSKTENIFKENKIALYRIKKRRFKMSFSIDQKKNLHISYRIIKINTIELFSALVNDYKEYWINSNLYETWIKISEAQAKLELELVQAKQNKQDDVERIERKIEQLTLKELEQLKVDLEQLTLKHQPKEMDIRVEEIAKQLELEIEMKQTEMEIKKKRIRNRKQKINSKYSPTKKTY